MKRPLLILQLLMILLLYAKGEGLLFLALSLFLLVGLLLAVPTRWLLGLAGLALLLLMIGPTGMPGLEKTGYLTRPSRFEARYSVGTLLVEGEELSAHLGRVVSIEAEVESPRGATNPGAFDYKRYLASRGITGIAEEVVVLRSEQGMFTELLRWRQSLLEHWWERLSTTFGPKRGASLYALLTGDTKGFDPEALRSMRASQLGHLFAVSGLHVGIAFGLARGASLGNRLPGTLVTVVVLSFYFLLVGGSLSFLRALGLVVIAEVCFYLKRPFDLLSALAIVGMPYLLFRPMALEQVSYQYSFGAVLIIGLIQRYLRGAWTQRFALFLGLGAVTFAVGCYHFRGYSYAGYLLNPLLLPLLPLIMVLLWLFLLTGGHLIPLTECLDMLTGYMWWVMDIGHGGYRSFVAPQASLVVAGLLVLLLLGIGLEGRGGARRGRWVLLVLCFLPLFWRSGVPRAEVLFFDVGHGDAQLIITAQGESILIDAGSSRSFADLGDLLLFQGIDHLDHLILSHAHEDHYGGLTRLVARGIEVKRVYLSKQTLYNRRALMRLLATAPRSIHVVEGGERTQGDDLRLEFLQAEGNDEPNASSLMTVVEIGGFRFLSTGDAERATEFALIDELPRGVDLLKVPHHGSKTSSSATFLEGVQPVVAVVSASGRYGLPDPTVRRRLDHFTELTLVTGESGAVVVRIFDDTFTLEDAGVD